MTIKFIKDYEGHKAGEVLPGCFRNGALELIGKGVAVEEGTEPIDPAKLVLPTPKTTKAEKAG